MTVPGLTSGGIYYVLVIDNTHIKLTTTQAAALTPDTNLKSFTPGDISSNTIT